MTQIAETTRAERWIHTQLTADATIAGIVGTRVYADVMPKSVTTYPAIVVQYDGSQPPTYGNGPTIIWTKLAYIVKAITKGNSSTSLQTLVDRVIAVLHAERGGVTGADIDYSIYTGPFRMTTMENDTLFQFLGGRFELAVRSADV